MTSPTYSNKPIIIIATALLALTLAALACARPIPNPPTPTPAATCLPAATTPVPTTTPIPADAPQPKRTLRITDADPAADFCRAVEFGAFATARKILAQGGAPPGSRCADDKNSHPLHFAAEHGAADLAQLLLDAGADANARNSLSETPLHFAALNRHAGIARLLLDAGADVNAPDSVQKTPLFWAAESEYANADMARILIAAGAQVNAKEYQGATILHQAAGNARQTETALALIAAGADVHAQTEHGLTPLHTAAENGNAAAVCALIDAGADIYAEANQGQMALQYAFYQEKNLAEITRMFIDAGFDPTTENYIIWGAYHGNANLAQILIAAGADIHAHTPLAWDVGGPTGITALHLAAIQGNADYAQALIDAGADVNAKAFQRDETPLHFAAAHAVTSETVTIAALLNAGADIHAKTNWGRTPLHFAVLPDPYMLDYSHTPRFGPECWHFGDHAKLNAVTLLIDAGADVNTKDAAKKTPLHTAACLGMDDVSATLIAAGANINAADNRGRTPLHYAALYATTDWTETIAALISAGADIHAKTHNGQTPLHYAAQWDPGLPHYLLISEISERERDARLNHYRKLNAASLLINASADLNAKDNAGQTPLHIAADLGMTDVATALIAAGANINATEYWGNTPADLASESGNDALAELLR